jgi:hypothetical protein
MMRNPSEYVEIDIPRMEEAINSPSYSFPRSLTREEVLQFLDNRAPVKILSQEKQNE